MQVYSCVEGRLLFSLEGHTSSVQRCMFFNKDHRRLLTSSLDGSLRVGTVILHYLIQENIKNPFYKMPRKKATQNPCEARQTQPVYRRPLLPQEKIGRGDLTLTWKLWCDIINLRLRTKPPIKSLVLYNFHIIQGGQYGSSISSSWVKLNHLSRNRALQFPKIPLGNKVECQVLNSKCHSVECRGTFFLKLVTVNEHGDKG